jgi:hypothetical protein
VLINETEQCLKQKYSLEVFTQQYSVDAGVFRHVPCFPVRYKLNKTLMSESKKEIKMTLVYLKNNTGSNEKKKQL